ncbi:M55 family metallopeptidase [Pseudoroseicyclus aestuarii]|uniref:D-amino peptidase n=1 Tax=Pseudoroseicyclus aestuarii TaxID=1795041 RepID=A0A318SPU2_9RHOB|nr:M55 family metallopeptidase [Pseudoroseicyclus aestuarii]PYE83890.1 D-amino peptidase [Pseudoroseicyclus aestuarii]
MGTTAVRIYISVDIEGVAGVQHPRQGRLGEAAHEAARLLMVGEANAAVRGAFTGGATEVTVADSHGPMSNIPPDRLDPRARLVQGTPRPGSMTEGLTEDFDGLVLIGWHAAAGARGVLAHTISGRAFAEVRVNGLLAGEPTLFGGHAAELGVPLLAVSGDDCLCEEVTAQFPRARRIVVKHALGAAAADSLAPAAACALIEEDVAEAVRKAGCRAPEAPCSPPLDLRVTLTQQAYADAAALLPGTERIGSRCIRFGAETHEEAIRVLTAFALMAAGLD